MTSPKPIAPASVWTNPIHFLAFGFGSGCLPFAPGTWGTLAAIPLYYLIQKFSLIFYLVITIIVIAVGIYLCDVACRDTQTPDHPGVVWDEIAGYFVTMIAAPQGLIWVVFGFILFRIFDITKPWPIKWIDSKVHGGFGVMLDDLVAAIPAWLILQLTAMILRTHG